MAVTRAPGPAEVAATVEAIVVADRRRRLRHRLVFAGTWVVLTTIIVLALTTRFDWAFLQDWWRFILAGA